MEFTTVGLITGTRFGVPLPQASLLAEPGGAGLRVFNPVAGETVRVALAATGLGAVAGLTSHGVARVAVTVGGVAGSVAAELVACARMAPGVGLTGYLGTAPTAAQAVTVMAVPVGGVEYLVAARAAGSGVEVFRINADQSLTRVAGLADTAERALDGVSALAVAQVGGVTVVFAGSAGEHGITAFAVNEGGGVSVTDVKGATTGVPVQGITCLDTVEAGGQVWLVAGAAGSSSLTVFRIGADGTMQPVDQVIDDLNTRFQGVTALDAVAVGGQVFVVAAGADDGISLFTLMPDGTLVHLSSLADGTGTGLANVSDLRVVVVDGVMQVIALSGAEAGVTQLSVDLRNLGVVGDAGGAGDDLLVAGGGAALLSGGAGRDVLRDGAGSDTLSGGAGADVFVLGADGRRDVIADFDMREDRIDLTRWAFFRNAGQLGIVSTATGAVLRFGAEELELLSANGKPLAEAALRALDYGATTRLVVDGPAPQTAPEPPPERTGTAGNDTLVGAVVAEVLSGFAGDDLILGGDGADTVYGGAGGDWLSYAGTSVGVRIDLRRWADGSAEVADDLVEGVEGFVGTALADTMTGSAGFVRFEGGAGDDILTAGTVGSVMAGGAGNDRIAGGLGADSLNGGEGDDWLTGGEGVDTLADGAGNDTLYGGGGAEWVAATVGNDWVYGDEGNDTLDGGIGNDRLFGGIGADRLAGGEGDDWLEGGDGDDSLFDGAGNDTLSCGAGSETVGATLGNDVVYGGEGNDALNGGAGTDSLFGGAGVDWLIGGDGNDWLDGGEESDSFSDGAGNDTLYAGAGDETITAVIGDDWLYGDDGADALDGGEGNDRLWGGNGLDRLAGGLGNDLLDGGAGEDLLGGGGGDDSHYGGAGNDALMGFGGNDLLDGGDGNDVLSGGSGDDLVLGGAGDDRLAGSTGNDTLRGGDGEDALAGLFGADRVEGGAGRDTLDGGRGNDTLTGGAGADVFLFTGFLRGETDVVTDFEDGVDRLRLLGLTGATDAAKFRGLLIRDVTIGGVDYAEINRAGHVLRIAGVDAADLSPTDFLFV